MKLTTLFNGRPAPGGSYNPKKRLYTKKVKSLNGGRHPRLDAYGAIDGPVLDELKALGCEIIRLCLPSGEHFVRFSVFEARAFPVRWRDTRYAHKRWYLSSEHWRGTLTEAREYRPLVIETLTPAPQVLQLGLFGAPSYTVRQLHEQGAAS